VIILLMLVGIVFLVYLLFKATSSDAPEPVIWFILALMGGLGYLLYQDADVFVVLWTGVTTWLATAMANIAAAVSDFLSGMAAFWSWVGFGLTMAIVITGSISILWPMARGLARIEVNRAKAQTAAAERHAEEERQKRIDAEQRESAARKLARQAVADKAEAERCSQGLSGQLAEAVRLADSRGLQLREIREKKRAENAGLPTQPDTPQGDTQQAVQAANGRHKKPHGTRGNKRTGKGTGRGRLPKK